MQLSLLAFALQAAGLALAAPSLPVNARSSCVDLVNPATGVRDCPKMISYCNNAAYYTLMTHQCPLTCGRCVQQNPVSQTTSCADKVNTATGVSDCLKMISYCNNSVYRSLMQQQCPKTCGFCK